MKNIENKIKMNGKLRHKTPLEQIYYPKPNLNNEPRMITSSIESISKKQ